MLETSLFIYLKNFFLVQFTYISLFLLHYIVPNASVYTFHKRGVQYISNNVLEMIYALKKCLYMILACLYSYSFKRSSAMYSMIIISDI